MTTGSTNPVGILITKLPYSNDSHETLVWMVWIVMLACMYVCSCVPRTFIVLTADALIKLVTIEQSRFLFLFRIFFLSLSLSLPLIRSLGGPSPIEMPTNTRESCRLIFGKELLDYRSRQLRSGSFHRRRSNQNSETPDYSV